MNKKTITCLMIFLNIFFFSSVIATTKNDIIGYVNSQSVCGDRALFNSYKSTFTRLLKQKKLSSAELSQIYSYLQGSVGILNSKGVCKVSDLSKLTEKEKNAVMGSLYAGAGIITSAPTLTFDEREAENNPNADKESKSDNSKSETNISKNVTGTNIVINSETGTMDVYENGVLIDKLSMTQTKMTYTGFNQLHLVIIVLSIAIFVISLGIFLKLYNTHKGKIRFVKNILVSLMICSAVLSISLIIFGTKLDELKSIVSLISLNVSDDEYLVKLNDDKSINTYPSYGLNYGKLKIDRLDINKNIYFGDTSDILNIGIGHSTWSSMPTENDVIVLSGHNNNENLQNLKNIQVGDKIELDLSYAKCRYKVVKIELLNDTDIDKLKKQNNKETLILYTCYPFDSYVYTSKRFVTYSVLEQVIYN